MALKKRKDGRYQRRVTLSNGKTKLVYGRTQAEVNAAARQALTDDAAGLEVGDSTTVGEWAKIWLTTYKADLRPATVGMYRNAYNKHIMDTIGGMELRAVRPVHIRRVMSAVADLSESTQHKVLITLRQLFDTAASNRLVTQNPAKGVKITPHARPKKQEYLSRAEYVRLLDAITEPRARVFCALCVYCGLRREEALGLRWTDIGPAGLIVARAVTFPPHANTHDPSMELKNASSHRIVPIPAPLREILADTPRLSDYVVPTANGEIMTRSAYRRMWDAYVVPHSQTPIHAHMLRHTYATELYHAGVDLRTAQQLMGHASIQMTAKIYTHLEAEDSLKVVARLNNYLSSNAV